MPVGVQVVGGKFGEENCVAVAKVIDELLGRSGAREAKL
jgi:Asp-tRNA(Asn)/Glu-tRNA(Gln) amidotransferase A subunit family amidase